MSNRAGERRRRTERAGHRAERIALLWLMLHGYRILARRYLVHGGEIDIIAVRSGTVAFVEVKARPTVEMAVTAVTPAKRRRIERAAALWLARHAWARSATLRGDVLAVVPWRLPRHLKDAIPLRF